MFRHSRTGLLTIALTLQACGISTDNHVLSYEEFKAQAFHGPGPDRYVVNGDVPIIGETGLRAAYEDFLRSVDDAAHPGESTTQQGLAIAQVSGRDDKWDRDTGRSLTYCVNRPGFGSLYNTVVAAIEDAAQNWGGVADVGFIHNSSQDNNCTNTNNNVLFNVSPGGDLGSFAAIAFFPSYARPDRQLFIATLAFNSVNLPALPFLLRHELGHVLGFRHEHTRPEAGACFEDNQWRALTAYDSRSVMHYQSCNGFQSGFTILTKLDILGARKIYPFVNIDDILWQNANGSFDAWTVIGTSLSTIVGQVVPPLPGAVFRGVADFNGDGWADLLRQDSNARWVISLANNLDPDVPQTQDPSDTFVGTGDFDGDGKSDILWRQADGNVRIWFMNGRSIVRKTSATGTPLLGPEWSIQGIADLNGAGRSDILWRKQDGSLQVWFMLGASVLADLAISDLVLTPEWSIRGTADFNSDGKSDILWRKQDGTVAIWLMNATFILAASSVTIPAMGPEWTVVGTGDFNRDGKGDILWRNANGTTAMWVMDGTAVTSAGPLMEQRGNDAIIRGVGRFNSL